MKTRLPIIVLALSLSVFLLGTALSGCSLVSPDVYTVTFDSNGGSAVAPAEGIKEGDPVSEPTAPTKDGYSFEGWYTDTGLTSSWDFSSDTVTEATTLYAKWSASTGTAYTVEHYQQDVSGDGYTKVTADTQNLQGTTGETATATEKSYTGFSENTTHTDRVASGTIAGDGSLVLKLYYDRNTYTVSYNENGGSSVTDTTDVRYGAMISAPTAPTKDGYSFEGWYTDAGLTSSWDFSSDTVTEATTLYAKWSASTGTAYTVDHYQQDVSGDGYSKVTADTQNLQGTTGETATATAKSYTGFSENTTHTDRVASGTIAGDGSLVLKLYYDRNTFTVSYDENGGSSVTDTTDVRYGAKITAPTAPTKDGYSFEGWYSDAGLTTAWDFSSDTVTEATTLYAKWSASTGTAYTVEHYQQDVSGDGYSKVTVDTQNLQGTTGETATATAKSYTGFSENTTHTDRVASGTIAGNGSLVLKLYYDRNTFTVSYDENGGSSVTDTTDVRYGAKITAPTAPTKIGYSFEGWYTDTGLTSSWDFSSDTVIIATTLYAKWEELTVGDLGPAGGYIFYDKGSYTDWWRYLEAAPADVVLDGGNNTHNFGYYRTASGGASTLVGTATGIGTGKKNTEDLVSSMGTTAYISNATSTTTTTGDYAARLCDTHEAEGYSDWFLPSKDELNLMYQNLKVKNLGGFSDIVYWSSSEYSASGEKFAWGQYFGGMYQGEYYRSNEYRVRPARAF